MKVKMAQTIQVYLCDECASVHIGMFRGGKLFAEAIPFDPKAFAADLQTAIAKSEALLSGATHNRRH
jgi:hypothetical protein